MPTTFACGRCQSCVMSSDVFCAECGARFDPASDTIHIWNSREWRESPGFLVGRTIMNNGAGQKKLSKLIATFKKVKIEGEQTVYNARVLAGDIISLVTNGVTREIPLDQPSKYIVNKHRNYVILVV